MRANLPSGMQTNEIMLLSLLLLFSAVASLNLTIIANLLNDRSNFIIIIYYYCCCCCCHCHSHYFYLLLLLLLILLLLLLSLS